MSFRRPALKRSQSYVATLNDYGANRRRVQNGAWRKRQNTLMITPKRYTGLSLFESASGIEQKNIDSGLVDLALPATNAFTGAQLLNGCAQGAAQNQRIGRKMLMKSVQYRFHLGSAAGVAPAQSLAVRILIVYDRQANGAIALNTDVLSGGALFPSQQNLANTDRFLVISDVIHGLDTDKQQPVVGKVFKKIQLDTQFGGAAGAIADINSGALIAFICTPGAAVAPVINCNFRVRFQDV